MRRAISSVAAGVSTVLVAVACGSGDGSTFQDPDSGAVPGDENVTFSDPGAFPEGGENDAASNADTGLNACAADTQQATLAPLDLLVMQDTSGSMWSYVSGTTSKWDSIKLALGTFVADPASAGIGLGIQFFPLFGGGVPNSCTTNAECGAGNACIYKACSKTGTLCQVAGDCTGAGNTCTAIQRCHGEQEFYCLTNADCTAAGVPGPCDRPIIRGTCQTEAISCTAPDYSAPVAAIAPLPGAGAAITAALAARIPNGQTPTKAALQGAIDSAKAYATAHSGHVVAVVLSTDGIPYTNATCDDNVANIQAVAAAGLAGTPSIKTFVIGVLSPADVAAGTPTLNGIAVSGGTGSATILGTSATTEADFIAALSKIRGQSLPCQFKLPVPEAGTPDYAKVNVVYTDSKTKAQSVIGYVANAAACDPTTGGWYYDADPSKGGTPTQVVLCPVTCSKLQSDPLGQIDVVQGCETHTQGPPH